MNRTTIISWTILVLGVAPVKGQDPIVELCDETTEFCTEASLEIVFGDAVNGDSVLPIWDLAEQVVVTVVVDTDVPGIQGWSYGFSHNPELLSILPSDCPDGTEFVCGTDTEQKLVQPSFIFATAVDGGIDSDGEPFPPGFVSAVVLSFITVTSLDIKRNSIARLTYSVADPNAFPAEGSLIQIQDLVLRNEPSPPVGLNLTIQGQAGRPNRIVHGLIGVGDIGDPETSPDDCSDGTDNDGDGLIDCEEPECECSRALYLRGDANDDGRRNITDAVHILTQLFAGFLGKVPCQDALDADDDGEIQITDALFVLANLFQRGAAIPAPSLSCGVDETADAIYCDTAALSCS